ncbi:hypothetical protein BGZ54_007573 [Gamsiella multidivaricata]|nr:hypothetical protein BGZ54_007573 [Gamsiella multidivaricata]
MVSQTGYYDYHLNYEVGMTNAVGSQLVNGDGPRITRDDIVTYDDVYNIFYQIKITESRRDEDPVISSNKWMVEVGQQGYFTCFDKRGVYYGFASQLIKPYGDVFCFDGTHEVCGFVGLTYHLQRNALPLIHNHTATGINRVHPLDGLDTERIYTPLSSRTFQLGLVFQLLFLSPRSPTQQF